MSERSATTDENRGEAKPELTQIKAKRGDGERMTRELERVMDSDTAINVVGILVPFVLFALVLAWADWRTHGMRQ
jgi:hypothetical protein